jgi:hypothetical protein
MTSDFSMIAVIDWDDNKKEAHHFTSAGNDGGHEFLTIAVKNSGVTFAIYDSVYAPRMPIIISANLPLRVLGYEYKSEIVPKSSLGRFLLASKQGFLNVGNKVVTLKSGLINPAPPHAAATTPALKDETTATHGYLMFAYEQKRFTVDTSIAQETLNIHAQDIHNSYHAMKWGEMVISLSRLIRVCY